MQALQPGIDERLLGLLIAIAIGLLVGLEREHAEDKPVGVRSFALIGGLGGLSMLVAPADGIAWLTVAGLPGLALLLAATHHHSSRASGITTLVAALVVYVLGAAAVAGYRLHVIVIGGITTVLLHAKRPLHGWVERIGDRDFEIIVRFVLIVLVILPILPNRTLGPFDVLNPFRTWLFVVLIVGMNLVGYLALRISGRGGESVLTGLIGGLVSSTATTIISARRTRESGERGVIAALVIVLASAVLYGRVLVELLAVSPPLAERVLLPSALFAAVLAALCILPLRRIQRIGDDALPRRENPARIREALVVGAVLAGTMIAVAAARDAFGDDALYAIAFVFGLATIDAVTLSVGELHAGGQIDLDAAWRAVFVATLSNLLFKLAVAVALGSSELRRWILPAGGIGLVAGAAIVLFWP